MGMWGLEGILLLVIVLLPIRNTTFPHILSTHNVCTNARAGDAGGCGGGAIDPRVLPRKWRAESTQTNRKTVRLGLCFKLRAWCLALHVNISRVFSHVDVPMILKGPLRVYPFERFIPRNLHTCSPLGVNQAASEHCECIFLFAAECSYRKSALKIVRDRSLAHVTVSADSLTVPCNNGSYNLTVHCNGQICRTSNRCVLVCCHGLIRTYSVATCASLKSSFKSDMHAVNLPAMLLRGIPMEFRWSIAWCSTCPRLCVSY